MSRLTEEIHAYCETHFISIQDEAAITSILEKRDKQLAEKLRKISYGNISSSDAFGVYNCDVGDMLRILVELEGEKK